MISSPDDVSSHWKGLSRDAEEKLLHGRRKDISLEISFVMLVMVFLLWMLRVMGREQGKEWETIQVLETKASFISHEGRSSHEERRMVWLLVSPRSLRVWMIVFSSMVL